jgi:hypothetical protein
MNVNTPGFYDIVKLCAGSLTLDLPAFDASANNKMVHIGWNVQKVRVPRQFALGILTDSTLTKMYEKGYFKVEPAAQFEKEIESIYYPVEERVKIVDDEKIVNALLKGDRVTIKNIMSSGEVNRQKVVVLARENIDSLSTSMVRDLEKILSVELVVENEDAE